MSWGEDEFPLNMGDVQAQTLHVPEGTSVYPSYILIIGLLTTINHY